MIDAALQRKNMVESQVRPSDMSDRRVIRAMLEVPREAFVPEALRSIAYMDSELPLAHAGAGRPPRAMMAPRTLAKLLQLAEFNETDVVLDIGAGTGYSSAVIARIVKRVVALEEDEALALEAAKTLGAVGVGSVAVVQEQLAIGAPNEGPYDVIVMEGAVADVPDRILDQLKDGGRLVAIVAASGFGQAKVWRRLGASFDSRVGFDAGGPLLPGFGKAAEFVL